MRNIRRKNYIKRLFGFGEQENDFFWLPPTYLHHSVRTSNYSKTFIIPVGSLKQNKNSLNKIIDKIKNSFKI